MKIVKSFALVIGLLISSSSWALMINGTTNVGNIDAIIDSKSLGNSSVAQEEAWVESVLGIDVAFEYKNDGTFSWVAVDNQPTVYVEKKNGKKELIDTIFAQALSTDPDYFLVKLGGGNFSGDTHVLYNNAASLSYAVIDLVALGQGATIDIARISHIAEFDGTSVPAPAPLALLSLGLLGMVASRRKNKA